MSIFSRFLFVWLSGARIAACLAAPGTLAGECDREKPAVVVHIIEGRIYLSVGRLDGVSSNWAVSRVPGGTPASREPLTWIGDDLCRIEPDSESVRSMRVGDTMWIAPVELPATGPTFGSVRWAVTVLPLPVMRSPVTLNDWDFREALYSHLGDFVEKIETDENGNSVLCLWADRELRFADNRPVDGDAIRESLRWLCGGRQIFRVWNEHFKSIRDTLYSVQVNPFTIQTNFPGYCENYRSFMDGPGFYVADIGWVDGRIDDHASGSGPYCIADVSDSTVVICERGDPYGSCLVDTIVFQNYDSYDAAKLAFELGEADLLEIAPYDVRRFEDHYEVFRDTLNAAVYLSVNNSKPYFADNLFAVALNYLVDKESLCRVPLAQMVAPIDHPPVRPDVDIAGPFEYDPRKGRQLLAQIDGLPEYMSLLVADRSDPGMVRTAEYVRGVLARHNISVTIYTSPNSSDTAWNDESLTSFDMMVARLDGPAGFDGQLLYQSYYHDDLDEIESNRSLFRSPEVEELFGESFLNCLGETTAGWSALQEIIYRHLNTSSGVWLYRPVRYIAVSRDVVSLRFLSNGVVDLTSIGVE